MMLDPIAAERAEAGLNKFIDSQAKKRKGAEEANALEAMWAASERRVQAQRREENKALWVEHYRRLTVAHLELAKDFRRRAREVQAIEVKEIA